MDGQKISKGIIGAFLLLFILVAVIGGLFLNQYIYTIILGAVFQTSHATSEYTVRFNDTFIADNTTARFLNFPPIVDGTLILWNASAPYEAYGASNFTVNYDTGEILLTNISQIFNSTPMSANYTSNATTPSSIRVTPATRNFLGDTENSFFSVLGNINSGATFAAALISIAVILLIFGGIVLFSIKKYRELKGKGGDTAY